MQPLTTSIHTFADLIRGGYKYVDKTAHIYRLVGEYKGQYFLSRPRRFGKSLLISTVKSIFLGQRELFDGLAIAHADFDWKTFPIIHLNMGSVGSANAEALDTDLLRLVRRTAQLNGTQVEAKHAYQAFEDLIYNLADTRGNVVILIDEYDKPLLAHLGESSAEEIQAVLKQFYSVIKTTEPCQRFALLTGVSKFSKVSVFSDLNNLTDLTMDAEFATLLGYTQDEVETNFPDYLEQLAHHQGQTLEQAIDSLGDWYNGYRFHHRAEAVYNPVSVMKCLRANEFANYWFETGTPKPDIWKRQLAFN